LFILIEANQTAVDWLKERLPSLFKDDSGHYAELFKQAKQIEKEQITDAWKDAAMPDLNNKKYANDYYTNTFGD